MGQGQLFEWSRSYFMVVSG